MLIFINNPKYKSVNYSFETGNKYFMSMSALNKPDNGLDDINQFNNNIGLKFASALYKNQEIKKGEQYKTDYALNASKLFSKMIQGVSIKNQVKSLINFIDFDNDIKDELNKVARDVLIFIMKRTIIQKKGFEFIKITDFINGWRDGHDHKVKGVKACKKSIYNAISELKNKGLIYIYEFDKYNHLYILNTEKGKEIFEKLALQFYSYDDIKQFDNDLRKKKSDFFMLKSLKEINTQNKQKIDVEVTQVSEKITQDCVKSSRVCVKSKQLKIARIVLYSGLAKLSTPLLNIKLNIKLNKKEEVKSKVPKENNLSGNLNNFSFFSSKEFFNNEEKKFLENVVIKNELLEKTSLGLLEEDKDLIKKEKEYNKNCVKQKKLISEQKVNLTNTNTNVGKSEEKNIPPVATVNYGQNSEEVKTKTLDDLVKLVMTVKYDNNTIDFSYESVYKSLKDIKLNLAELEEIIKNQIKYLPYRTFDKSKYTIKQIFINSVKKNLEAPKEFIEIKEDLNKKEMINKYLLAYNTLVGLNFKEEKIPSGEYIKNLFVSKMKKEIFDVHEAFNDIEKYKNNREYMLKEFEIKKLKFMSLISKLDGIFDINTYLSENCNDKTKAFIKGILE